MSAETVKVAGVAISNPDKVWWPDEGITKSDIARFYDSIWSQVSPWMDDRPLTAERCPDDDSGGTRECTGTGATGSPGGSPTRDPILGGDPTGG